MNPLSKGEKEVSYEKERLKKLRDTQFDILSSLDVEEEKEIKEPSNHYSIIIPFKFCQNI